MPSTWRVHVIAGRLQREGLRVALDECDVYALEPDLRRTVIDVLIAERAGFPMVVVDGAVVCHDGVDLDAVVRAVREESVGECCC